MIIREYKNPGQNKKYYRSLCLTRTCFGKRHHMKKRGWKRREKNRQGEADWEWCLAMHTDVLYYMAVLYSYFPVVYFTVYDSIGSAAWFILPIKYHWTETEKERQREKERERGEEGKGVKKWGGKRSREGQNHKSSFILKCQWFFLPNQPSTPHISHQRKPGV